MTKKFLFLLAVFLLVLIGTANATDHTNTGYTLGVINHKDDITLQELQTLASNGVNAIAIDYYWANHQATRNGAIDVTNRDSILTLAKQAGIHKFYLNVTASSVPQWFHTLYPDKNFVTSTDTNVAGYSVKFRFACQNDNTNWGA